jgi:RNA polymerase sigma-70 factor (ECF subfamily)
VAKALGLLAESDRALLLMDAWDDLGTAAMSAVLGCSRAAVRVRLLRARRRLARALDDHSVAVPKAPSAATAHPAFRCKEKT